MSEVVERPVNHAVVEGLAQFAPSALKHVDAVPEKVVLPSKEDIETEKKHIEFVNGVEGFDKNKLKRTVTNEKVVLPDKESKLLI